MNNKLDPLPIYPMPLNKGANGQVHAGLPVFSEDENQTKLFQYTRSKSHGGTEPVSVWTNVETSDPDVAAAVTGQKPSDCVWRKEWHTTLDKIPTDFDYKDLPWHDLFSHVIKIRQTVPEAETKWVQIG